MTRETILVTGATGFIGSHVVGALLSQGAYPILVIVRKNRNDEKIEALKQKGVAVVEGEFYDPILLEQMFQEYSIRHVIHLAALRGAGGGTWEDYYEVNVRGTETLLEASWSHNVKKFIYCSSVGVYGTVPSNCPATLDTPLNGDNHYHSSKIQAEKKVQESIQKGLDAYILRPTITYGLGHTGFPKSLASLVRKRMFLLPPNDVKIHLLSVSALSDLVTKMVDTESTGQRIFVVADEEPISLKELVHVIYFHYYKVSYPSFLKIPKPFIRFLVSAVQLSRNEKWLTRLLLISKSWRYDIHETIQAFQYVPARTRDSFIESLRF